MMVAFSEFMASKPLFFLAIKCDLDSVWFICLYVQVGTKRS